MTDPAAKILVTAALPYANGHIHIGHLVEYIQTDIWVRYQKLRDRRCIFLCADDTHGTAIMIRARQEGRPEAAVIGDMREAHIRDFALFDVQFDNYGSTNSEHNRALCHRIWKSLLQREIAQHLQRQADDPRYAWLDTGTLRLYQVPGRPPPPGLSTLPRGVHDDFWFGGRENVVLVSRVRDVDYFVVRDITGIETVEEVLIAGSLLLALVALAVIGVLASRGVRKALRPLSELAGDIGALSPDHAGQRVAVADSASSELHVITNALNDYLRRQDDFVERERVFILAHRDTDRRAPQWRRRSQPLECDAEPCGGELGDALQAGRRRVKPQRRSHRRAVAGRRLRWRPRRGPARTRSRRSRQPLS